MRRGHLTIVEPRRTHSERVQIATRDEPSVDVIGWDATALASCGPFDLIVAGGSLQAFAHPGEVLAAARRQLVPAGLVVLAEAAPDAFHDVVLGLDPEWFSRSASADFPVGPLRTAEDWTRVLAQSGFGDVELVPIGPGAGALTLLLARRDIDETLARMDVASETAPGHDRKVLIVAAGEGAEGRLAEELSAHLAKAGRRIVRVKPEVPYHGEPHAHVFVNGALHFAPESPESWDTLLKMAVTDDGDLPEIVHLVGAFANEGAGTGRALRRRLAGLVALRQALGERKARVWLAAPGGARGAAGLGSASAAQSALWSFIRVAMNEMPDADWRLVDFESTLDMADCADRLSALISAPGDEREIVLGRDSACALRVSRGLPATAARPDIGSEVPAALALSVKRQGSLSGLAWQPRQRRKPEQGEVEIEIEATGLNFRDVMWAQGMLPDEALEDGFAGPGIGFECSGRIGAVGPGVSGLEAGDAVIALAPEAFATHVTVPQAGVAKLPEGADLVTAAGIPVAFLTAYYALVELARLRQDEWLLVHGAAGGVGLAAMQIARWKGARVIATAGTEEKRELLRLLGAEHVLSSRSLAFADEVKTITGDGVDVVLNSLSGEAMERSIGLVRPFGRFLELGKRDYFADTRIGLRPFRRNVSYFGIDADQLLAQQPALAGRLFSELMQHLAEGRFAPLPVRRFEAHEAVDAFRLMQQSGHVGKIVIAPPRLGFAGIRAEARPVCFDGTGQYVVVGGTGGFGLETARWLAGRGVRHIALVGRSGRLAGGDPAILDELRAEGVEVRIEACDAANRKALAGLLSRLRAARPICGVIHAAMVLDDAAIHNLDVARIGKVLQPKVEGAANLDRLTREDGIEQFILFSSVSALIGNPGQAAYAAANGFLEGLARRRREESLPAVAIGWGPIADTGYLARHEAGRAVISRRAGTTELKARHALGLLAEWLSRDQGSVAEAVLTVAPMDWSVAAGLPLLATPAFTALRREAEAGGRAEAGSVDLAAAVAGLDPRAARDLVARLVAKEVATIFRMAPEEINADRPLAELGMDSLMGLELRVAAQRALGVEIPMSALADGLSVNSMADRILVRLGGEGRRPALSGAESDLVSQHLPEAGEAGHLAPLGKVIARRQAGLEGVL